MGNEHCTPVRHCARISYVLTTQVEIIVSNEIKPNYCQILLMNRNIIDEHAPLMNEQKF